MPKSATLEACLLAVATASRAAAQLGPPDYDFQWATVAHPGNRGYDGPDPVGWNQLIGRGSVPYEYRISILEVTTAQWMEFVNTFSTQSDDLRFFGIPTHWGAARDASYSGPGWRCRLRDAHDAAMRPVYGIDWRAAARYCNWLHNGKSSDLASLEDGAYDASTFTYNPDFTFNDQGTRSLGSLFWIPSIDEWIKSVHYDPDRFGPGLDGWWEYPHRSNDPPISGPPGVGETSAGYTIEPFGHFDIPLGAYPQTLTPWGLLDATGGASEWTEEIFEELYERRSRFLDGRSAGTLEGMLLDHAASATDRQPTASGYHGLRVASPVPRSADFNRDGTINSQDFFDFLSAFFAGDPTADFNRDQSINSQDFFDYLTCYFMQC